MKINLKDAFLMDHFEKNVSFDLAAEDRADLSSLALIPCDPKVDFRIQGKFGAVFCDVLIDLDYESFCSRCLTSVKGHLQIKNRRRMVVDPLKEEEDTILIGEDYSFIPEEEARNQIILEFPERFLCSENCKGLCPVCGCNLNVQNCNCETADE